MNIKRILPNITLLAMFLITSCGGENMGNNPSENGVTITEDNVKEYYKVGDAYTNKRINDIKEDPINGIYDDFTSFNNNNWYVASRGWGAGNNGVKSDFVRLTDDQNGVISFKGNGNYCVDKDSNGNPLSRVGSALISKFKAKPGHYEIKMKVHPRTGACSAFWTYAYKGLEDGHINSEIDIELPGGSKSGSITFEKALNTNWIAETASDSVEYAISNVDPNSESVAYNDGKWHTFGFDWYTDPAVVVYYADGVITNVSNVFVCDLEGRLWLGVWFPQALVGPALFETDYMLVDYVSYTPFKNQPYEEFDADHSLGSDNVFNSQPISLKTVNKISQGNFEFIKAEDNLTLDERINYITQKSGWEFRKPLKGEGNTTLFADIKKGIGIGNDDLYAAEINNGGLIRQNIDSVYTNYKYKLEFDAKSSGISAKDCLARISCFSGIQSTGNKLLSKEIKINSEEFNKYQLEIEAPKGTQSIRVEFVSVKDSQLIVDNVNLNHLI